MKIVDEEQNLHICFRNFDEIFRKYVTYDNIKSCKKEGLQPLSLKYIFEETTGEGVNFHGNKQKTFLLKLA